MQTPKVLDPEQALEGTIAVAMTLSTQIGDGRSLVMQTFIERDAPLSRYHATLDNLAAATDRQKAKYDLQAIELSLATHIKTLTQLREDMVRIEAERDAAWKKHRRGDVVKLSAAEITQKSQAEISIKRYVGEITKLEVERDKLKAEIAGS